jgi:ABC-type multidrug transport system permease subunit
MRTLVVDGWDAGVGWSLVVLALVAVACLAAGTRQFRKRTGERVQG